MRYRISFVTGFAVGFVVGARAGRERYEQIKKVARKAADNPAVQQAAGAAQAQAAGLAKSAKDKAMQQVPGLTAKAKNVGETLQDHVPARWTHGGSEGADPNGTAPQTSAPGTTDSMPQS